jgi:hypothetical protein
MNDILYDIGQLFQLAFGINNPVYLTQPIVIGRGDEGSPVYSPSLTPTGAGDVRFSWMGTPILFPFSLKGGIYRRYDRSGELEDYPLDDFDMPAATLVDFSRAKQVINTKVLGSNGSVKELYSFDDWRVRIRGLCLTDPSRRMAPDAEEQREKLVQWEQVAQAVNVTGALFQQKNIYSLVIEEVFFRQIEGRPGVIPFEMECLGDEPIELTL